ncbi:hypothetical protein Back11_11440 [Paenibacillus baekrokdamisoli]|uniref:Uncharacterized protein n=1 Tax=Paenibacillus baekrokdamisoli TaxID=1712516 RepID=A0A3G9J9Z5_9BACL|nr:hypothetical protein [Paenibacillus baekrokdamisoli]MBB3070445.1 hypothetical protein [Paenibacillus baekrokdamisoli]BBH19799.1 hypothetical protein Back11_11440 [Paenibacillus baekrokdamisoli]
MNRLYIIVQTNKSEFNDQQMITRNSEREVIGHAGSLAMRGGLEDDIEIDRIFSVNEYGSVDHHEIEFEKGKLILKTLPTQTLKTN